MRVLHVFDKIGPSGGGTASVIKTLAEAQIRSGNVVTVWTTDVGYQKGFIEDTVEVVPFHCFWSFGGYLMVGATSISSGRFDIIHLHQARGDLSSSVQLWASRSGTPCLMDDHGSLPRLGSFPKRALKWFYDLEGSRYLRGSTRVIVENSFSHKYVRSFGVKDSKIVEIPLGYPIKDYTDLPKKGYFDYLVPPTTKKILFLGRINFIKGLDFLLEAYKEVLVHLKEKSVLIIAGPEDGYGEILEATIPKKGLLGAIKIVSTLSRTEVIGALVDADVVVQPSRFEQTALVPVESLLCGTPVITTKTGAGQFLKDNLRYNWQVDFGATKELATMIVSVLAGVHQDSIKRDVAVAAAIVRSGYPIDQMIEKYETLYSEVVVAK